MTRLIFEKQGLHAVALGLLLFAAYFLSRLESFRVGELWGIGTLVWFWLAVAVAVVHQVYVWLSWRLQLHTGLLTGLFGERAFTLYVATFTVLGISRVLVVFALAISNRDTLPVDQTLLRVLAVIALIPALYLFYSVHRYFGFRRAFGIDHFDPRYRSMPFVREGIFRFTANGMYVFGFLLIWFPALWWASSAALAAALFNHLYIWVHYFVTEQPDMKRIYGVASTNKRNGRP